jgi:hypothetical protein
MKIMKIYKIAQEEYKGSHEAATKESGAPLYDLTGIYPDNIYSEKGARFYGDRLPCDNESISIIHAARGKPNYPITIYRAVPDVNREINVRIREYQKIVGYYNKFGFFSC